MPERIEKELIELPGGVTIEVAFKNVLDLELIDRVLSDDNRSKTLIPSERIRLKDLRSRVDNLSDNHPE